MPGDKADQYCRHLVASTKPGIYVSANRFYRLDHFPHALMGRHDYLLAYSTERSAHQTGEDLPG